VLISSIIFLKEFLSIPQKPQSNYVKIRTIPPTAKTDADLGALNINANSPNA
jgi:hypothetical protein